MIRTGAWFGACLSIFSAAAAADQPSKDPAVMSLRQSFAAARVPSIQELHPGSYWDCEYLSAEPGSHARGFFPGAYRFDVTSGRVLSAGDPLSSGFRWTSTSMTDERVWGRQIFGIENVRAGQDGTLLVESTLPACRAFECLFLIVRDGGIENTRELLVGYSRCQLER